MSKDRGTEKLDHDEALMAIGPIDGRYRSRTRGLAEYFSEYALIRYRVRIEIEWYLALAANPAIDAISPIGAPAAKRLRALYHDFAIADARRVKALEAETNHDVKALEYFLKEKIGALELGLPLEMVHFACTSEDISNLAYALILKEFTERSLLPALDRIRDTLGEIARQYKDVAMIARTHGQEASPTTVGKEFAIFAWRLERQMGHLRRQEFLGKANGAVGNFNAHRFAYPEVDWLEHSRNFVEGLGLTWNPLTTQIESHDFLAELFDTVERVDTILLGFARDIWAYISIGYFTQKTVAGEVGSSVMPHKVNPIDFENCEGNLGLATAMFQHLATKLPVSRLERQHGDSRHRDRVRPLDRRAEFVGARARQAGDQYRAHRGGDRRRKGVGSAGRGDPDDDAAARAGTSVRAAQGIDAGTRGQSQDDRGIRGWAAARRCGQGGAAAAGATRLSWLRGRTGRAFYAASRRQIPAEASTATSTRPPEVSLFRSSVEMLRRKANRREQKIYQKRLGTA
jgi:adenylosuccinate lyase